MDEQAYAALVDLIYETTLDPGLWRSVVERLAELMGGESGTLIRQDQVTGEAEGLVVNVDPVSVDLFRAHYGRLNPLQKLTDPVSAARRVSPAVLTDEESLPKSEMVRTEYYNDFLRRFDVHSLAIVNLAVIGVDDVAISINRPRSRPQFDARDLAIAAAVRPHMARAFRLGEQLTAARGFDGDLARMVEHSAGAVALLGDGGQVVHLNGAMRDLVGRRDGLAIVGGRLSTAGARDAGKLDAMIRQAAKPDAASRCAGALALGGPSRRRPLSVSVAPYRSERFTLFGDRPSVVVCVTDLDAGVSVADERLESLFDLTPAELRVARALFEGLSLREAADSLGLSFFTVRGHLARIREKTNTRGQVELARLMMRLADIEPPRG